MAVLPAPLAAAAWALWSTLVDAAAAVPVESARALSFSAPDDNADVSSAIATSPQPDIEQTATRAQIAARLTVVVSVFVILTPGERTSLAVMGEEAKTNAVANTMYESERG